jgi:hypothetical protein
VEKHCQIPTHQPLDHTWRRDSRGNQPETQDMIARYQHHRQAPAPLMARSRIWLMMAMWAGRKRLKMTPGRAGELAWCMTHLQGLIDGTRRRRRISPVT